MSEEVEIEEYQDLLDELNKALTSESSRRLIEEEAINALPGRNKLSVQQIRGWLFSFYSASDNYQSYNRVNRNSIRLKELIERVISLDDIELCNVTFET